LDDDENENRMINNINRENISQMKSKIQMKALLAVVRLLMLYFFYNLDGNPVSPFLAKLIGFLLIHEGLVMTNMILMHGYIFLNERFLGIRLISFPPFFQWVDILNNL
jgi:hypothetical protein